MEKPKEPFYVIRKVRFCNTIENTANQNFNFTYQNLVSGTFDSLEDLSDFAELGAVVQFDLFGFESYLQPFTFPNDSQRIDMIQHLMDDKKIDKILASSDIHTKHSLVSQELKIVDIFTWANS